MDWLAQKHALFVHLPIAAALLLPLPLLAAQRAGRGIKPWWNTCRYLTWMGVLFALPTLFSGFAALTAFGPLGRGLAPAGPVRAHQISGLVALGLGLLTLQSLYRGRKEHEGLGTWSLLLGVLWAGATAWGALDGHALHLRPRLVAVAPKPTPALPEPPRDPESQLPLRALDHARLESLHDEPLRSRAHEGLWVRTWVSPGQAATWKEGGKLPAGAYAVLTTQLDRWGRPGPEAGPLLFLEGTSGRPTFSLYWGHIPEARRADFAGEERVYWRGQDPHLAECLRCHAEGYSQPAERTSLRRRRPAGE